MGPQRRTPARNTTEQNVACLLGFGGGGGGGGVVNFIILSYPWISDIFISKIFYFIVNLYCMMQMKMFIIFRCEPIYCEEPKSPRYGGYTLSTNSTRKTFLNNYC